MDLMRELMLKLEAFTSGRIVPLSAGNAIQTDGHSLDEVFYRLGSTNEAFFTYSVRRGRFGPIEFAGLTWAGHDL